VSASAEAAAIRWGNDGLVPVVAVDAGSGDVLMVASMNAEALTRTRETGVVHYWSRSRGTLWRKGETSGHEQRLVEIRINCNRDSLLLRVEQRGAVCHDGYPSCYYRRLDRDGAARIIRERAFDPAAVYGPNRAVREQDNAPVAIDDPDPIERWFGAYLALSEQDLTAVSGTSRLLRADEDRVSERLADELEELAGVLDGSHRHGVFSEDVALEATQCLYWAALSGVRQGMNAGDFGAMLAEPGQSTAEHSGSLADDLRATAARIRQVGANPDALADSLPLLARAVAEANTTIADLVDRDTAEMRGRPYLADYFARVPSG
jgi:phosphoribosyl-AMP cyclohydrolase/phosphoribosyl-ATP pyrophosphohydrolase